MKNIYILLSIFILIFLVGCSSEIPSNDYKENEFLKSLGNSIKVDVRLSPNAKLRLENLQETIIIAAYLSGPPKSRLYLEDIEKKFGELHLGKIEEEVKTEGVTILNLESLDKVKIGKLLNKDFNVLINVFSGRRALSNNILSCAPIEGKISRIIANTQTTYCTLIGESISNAK